MNPLKTYRQEKKEEPLIGEYGLPICNLYWDGELKISTPSLKRRMEKSNMQAFYKVENGGDGLEFNIGIRKKFVNKFDFQNIGERSKFCVRLI